MRCTNELDLAKRGTVGLVVFFALTAVACATGTPGEPQECGDGVTVGTEECDDGNAVGGDGCDALCAIEAGYTCDDADPSVCGPLCGDGLVLGSETCDGTNLNGATCESLELGGGDLACDVDTCQVDTSGCQAYTCGNGTVDGEEECDGADTGGETCEDLGYDGGTLACTIECLVDTSACLLFSCGDGVVEGMEECDDGNSAAGDGCSSNCSVEDGWVCVGQPSVCAELCGNHVQDTGEECDGAELGGQTCESLGQGYVGGTLACGPDCTFNTAGCDLPTCGNSALDAGEDCDGGLLGGETCATVGGYIGGTLGCLPSCSFDLSGCIPVQCGDGIVSPGEACDDGNQVGGDGCNILCNVESGWTCSGEPSGCTPNCGNSQLDAGEQCDGALLGGQTCVGLGYDLGTLACTAGCTYDTTACSTFSCGDGLVTGLEQCDGANLDGQTCQTVGSYVGGTLLCLASCAFDLSGCIPVQCGDGIISAGEQCDDNNTTSGDGCNVACQVESGWTCNGEPSVCTPLCGNSQLDAGEQCDGALLGGQTCVGLGYVGGTLLCTAACAYDTSSCIAPSCGDGIISAGEACDDNNATSGDGCNAACQVESGWTCNGEPSNCTLLCGNATWDPGEDCDGGDMHGGTCQTQGYAGGTLTCNADCTFNTSACLASVCPNGIREGTEECDGSDFGGADCTTFGFSTGSLACTGACVIDTSGCSMCPATLTSVFSETFATPSSSSWTTGTDAAVSTSRWSAYTLPNHGVRIYNGLLEITNDESGSPVHGQGYAYVKTGGAGSDYDNGLYDPTLGNNAGLEVVWSLNMHRNDPDSTDGGFSCTSTSSQNRITVGLAYVLAGSSAAGLNASTSTCNASATAFGYAVVMGGSGGSVRLVRFEDGLRNGAITDIVSSGGFDPDRYFSVRVTYNADTDLWQLEVRNDGSSSFSDPAAGSYGFTGTGTNATHVNAALEYSGPYFQTGCTGFCSETYIARFDNVQVGVRCAP